MSIPLEQTQKRIGDYLVDINALKPEQIQAILAEQHRNPDLQFGQAAVKLGYVDQAQVMEARCLQMGISVVDSTATWNRELIESTGNNDFLRKYRVLPVKREGPILHLAMEDPLNTQTIDILEHEFGCIIKPWHIRPKDLEHAYLQVFDLPDIDIQLNQTLSDKVIRLDEKVKDMGPAAEIVQLTLNEAARRGASDIHIEPQTETVLIRLRIGSELIEPFHTPIPVVMASTIIGRIKVLADMNQTERRLPLDGRQTTFFSDKPVDIRVATLPTVHREEHISLPLEAATIRLLDQHNAQFNFDNIDLNTVNKERLGILKSLPFGLIIVTGPVNTGKTTLLYAMLETLADKNKKIITIEDPPERILPGTTQVPVDTKVGRSFEVILKAILRHDFNITLVGEMRDKTTATLTIEAANLGRLVLSTLHANDTAIAIIRLKQMGIEPYQIASTVKGVVSQRLLARLCTCAVKENKPRIVDGKEYLFYRPNGCSKCSETGFLGRIAIHEVMPVTRAIRDLIMQTTSSDVIRDTALQEGMIPMRQDGLQKAVAGLTTFEEVEKATASLDELLNIRINDKLFQRSPTKRGE